MDDCYDFDELIENLEDIRDMKEGKNTLNIPKALYCLAKEIEEIHFYNFFKKSQNEH